MPNPVKLIFQRVVIVSLAILVQILFLLAGLTQAMEYWRWVTGGIYLLSWVCVVLIISNNSNPSYKIAWIVLLLAFPVAGVLIYLLFGGNRISRKESVQLAQIEQVVAASLPQNDAVIKRLAREEAPGYNHARYLHSSSGYPIYDNSFARYFPDGDACWQSMLEDLKTAKQYIFLEFFILDEGVMWNSILDILKEKAAQGVDVRVLYDDFGCITRLPMRYAKTLESFGIRARAFNPYVPLMKVRMNNRDHRKLMIIDGEVGYTGGINLADEYINRTHPYGVWKDCGIRISGEAVWSMTVMFLSMWDPSERLAQDVAFFRPKYAPQPNAVGYIQPFADSPLDGEDIGAAILQSLIQSARQRVWLMTPYLILDDKMTSALCVAAKTGVDVRIITPGTPDKWYVHAVTRANYEVLTEAGVRIFEYQPGFVHAKVCLSDDCYAVVGTVNLDFRSLYLHFEDAVYLAGCDAVRAVADDFEAVLPQCREMTFGRCKHVYLYQRLLRSILRVFSPLL